MWRCWGHRWTLWKWQVAFHVWKESGRRMVAARCEVQWCWKTSAQFETGNRVLSNHLRYAPCLKNISMMAWRHNNELFCHNLYMRNMFITTSIRLFAYSYLCSLSAHRNMITSDTTPIPRVSTYCYSFVCLLSIESNNLDAQVPSSFLFRYLPLWKPPSFSVDFVLHSPLDSFATLPIFGISHCLIKHVFAYFNLLSYIFPSWLTSLAVLTCRRLTFSAPTFRL